MVCYLVLRHVAECFEDATQGLVSLPDTQIHDPKDWDCDQPLIHQT